MPHAAKRLGDQTLQYDRSRSFKDKRVTIRATPEIVTISWQPGPNAQTLQLGIPVPEQSNLRARKDEAARNGTQAKNDRIFASRAIVLSPAGHAILAKLYICANPTRGMMQHALVTFSLLGRSGRRLRLRYLFGVTLWDGSISYNNEGRDYEDFPDMEVLEILQAFERLQIWY